MTNIEPLAALLLVEKIDQQEKTTKSGLVLSAMSLESELTRGKVIAKGEGQLDMNGVVHPLPVEVGDIVVYNESNGTEVTDDENNKYHFVAFNNIYGKIAQ